MASRNTSPSPDYSGIDDIIIVPPQPVTQKEYKEEVPDISTISDIVGHESQRPNFGANYLGPQIRPKEFNVPDTSIYKPIALNHGLLPYTLNSNDLETFQTKNIPNYCCCKDQQSKLQKSLSKCERRVSSDSGLGESKKSEETCEKEAADKSKFKDLSIMCPACFKKPCTCNFSSKEYNANLHSFSDSLSSIKEYLKQQNQKIDSIHEKVSNFISQHTSCLVDQTVKENSNVTESDIPYILNILEVHSDKIRDLEDQINLLKLSEPKSLPTPNNKIEEPIVNQPQTINCVNTETCKEYVRCPCFHNAICHEQKQKITKTSTSTMTSLVIENNDRFVYHKKTTAVPGVREKKESPCVPKEHDSPPTKKYLDGEVNSNSQKRKSHKLNNCSPSLKCKQNLSPNSSSDVLDLNDNQVLKTSHKSKKSSKHASTRNKVIEERVEAEDQPNPPKLKNVLKSDDLAMKDNDDEEKNNSPALKKAAHKSHSRSSKQKQRNSMSPKIVDTVMTRDHRDKKMSRKTSESSSSTDTEYNRTKQRQKVLDETEQDSEDTEPDFEDVESTTVSKYGLSSKNLSQATKRYLDNYGLRRTKRLSNQYDS